MLETVKIRKMGYSVRFTFEEFTKRYLILVPRQVVKSFPKTPSPPFSKIRDYLVSSKDLINGLYQCGKTRIFMRDNQVSFISVTIQLPPPFDCSRRTIVVCFCLRPVKIQKIRPHCHYLLYYSVHVI